MTSGVRRGTGGSGALSPWAAAYAVIAVATVAIAIVNVLSEIDERSWMERPIAWWQPAVWEGTSAIVLLALAWVPGWTVLRFPPSGPNTARHLAIHLGLTIPFSLTHVGLMVLLRHAAYALAGERYDFGASWYVWLYEYRKDLISYVLYAATFWLTARLIGARSGAAAPRDPPPPGFVIDEGQRVLRVAPAEILAARSSGNYVEFLLADGRRPLMRTTLAGTESALAGQGFVRTHRSWMVNARHVSAIEAQGSGDHGLTLCDGTRIPLSRRYRDALATLRRG